MKKENVRSGQLTFIGALKNLKLIVPGKESREIRDFPKAAELIGCGNISLKEGKPFPHLHIMTGNWDYEVRGRAPGLC